MNKEKIQKAFLKIVAFIIIVFILIIWLTDSDVKDSELKIKNSQNITMQKIKKPLIKQNKNIGKFFTIEHKKSFDIDGYTGPVNLWLSFENRTWTGEVKRYDTVELLDFDKNNFYCKIKKDKNIGWCLCDWLDELPKEMKSVKTS